MHRFIGAQGNNIIITSLVSLTSQYSVASFIQPFNTITFNNSGPGTLAVTGLTRHKAGGPARAIPA